LHSTSGSEKEENKERTMGLCLTKKVMPGHGAMFSFNPLACYYFSPLSTLYLLFNFKKIKISKPVTCN